MSTNDGHGKLCERFVIALNDYDLTYAYPEEVKLIIRQEQQADYVEAADFINVSGFDLCILEHEFGIFGGAEWSLFSPLASPG